MAVDENRLTQFLEWFVADLGATVAAGNVVVGDRLGLYRAMAAGPLRPEELATRTETAPRYLEEGLRGQAAGGYVEYGADTGQYWLTEEQAFALTDPDGAVYPQSAFMGVDSHGASIDQARRRAADNDLEDQVIFEVAAAQDFGELGSECSGNLNPVGRVYYSFSSFLCVPNALSQEGGYSLGAQAGEGAVRRLVLDAGFKNFRRVAETPFNIVYEARP